jgi:hypothetical protein
MKRLVVINKADYYHMDNPLGLTIKSLNILSTQLNTQTLEEVSNLPRHQKELVELVKLIKELSYSDSLKYVEEGVWLDIEEIEGEYLILQDGVLEQLIVKDQCVWK